MRKLFLKISMLLFVLGMSVNAAWGQEAVKQPIYLLAFKANQSQASTGTGAVRLTWLDIKGKPIANSEFVGSGKLNEENPVEGETAQMLGGTMFSMDGVESGIAEIGGTGSQIYPTSYVYFHAEGLADNGSYFYEWNFTDPAIERMSGPMGEGSEEIPYRTPCFKVLPVEANNALYPMETLEEMMAFGALMTYVSENPNNIYAVFKKYLLANPAATTAQIDAGTEDPEVLEVTFEVEGDLETLDDDWSDFAELTFTSGTEVRWSCDWNDASKEEIAANRVRITLPVQYLYPGDHTTGLKSTVLTVSMAGDEPSVLEIPLNVNALPSNRPQAIWYDGETLKAQGNLTGEGGMLSQDIDLYDNPILKINMDADEDITLPNKNFTLDLNGYSVGDITVEGGEITIAYNKLGGEAGELSVEGGKVILNGGTFSGLSIAEDAVVEQNGATITDAATNAGSLTTTEGIINGGLTSSNGTLILNGGTFNGATAVSVSGGTANINRGTLNGTTSGLLVSGGTVTVKKLAAITSEGSYSAQRTGGTLNVESGKFGKPLNGTINFTAGFFKNTNYGVSTDGKVELLVSAGVEYNEGYRYFLGDNEAAQDNGVGVCRIGSTSYTKLEDALAYANNNPNEEVIIYMTNNYTLPAGYYTLPAKATLVVPMSDEQVNETNKKCPRVSYNDMDHSHPYVTPSEFRRLTFANGVNMDVFGEIEMTGTQFSSNEAYTSQPYGPYGHIVMEEGSHMTLQSGSELRAWGFMTGKGETDARRGAKVREMFQMGDWKGAMVSVRITGMVPQGSLGYEQVGGDDSDKKIFPVSQYFIQNVESPVKYHPGATLSTSATVSEGLINFLAVSMTAPDIKIIGVDGTDAAIFVMNIAADADNTWVRKWYDAENDIQVYDINSGARIGSMVLDMGRLTIAGLVDVPVRLNSAKFDLPLTTNFKIHLLSGEMDFKQNTCLLPGAEVEVDKESIVTVAKDNNDPEHTGALYVFDQDEWNTYAYPNKYTKIVRYSPSWDGHLVDGKPMDGKPTRRSENVKPDDAKINVHGTFNTDQGYVFTSAGGANITSSNEDAGTFIFNQDAEDAGERTVYQAIAVGNYPSITFTSAQLKNGIGVEPSHATTTTAEAGDAYCYTDNKWNIMKVDEDDNCFMVDGYDVFYAKPQEYVALANGKTENEDHTYSDAAGTGRLFILMGAEDNKCQWWEVEKKDNLYHCLHPDNDTYYYWDEDENGVETWIEKKFTITWLNWDGTEIPTNNGEAGAYKVTYGTMAEFLGTNPKRDASADYTYDFAGWTPELGPVTKDVTYTATFEPKQRKYTITFLNYGGTLIETQFLPLGASPKCENPPTKTGHYLVWSPSIAPVAGDATYTATWEEAPRTEFDITFKNYDGTTLKKAGGEEDAVYTVTAGSTDLVYDGAEPTKEDVLSEYEFSFIGWKGLDGNIYTDALPAAEDDATYVAQFEPAIKRFNVRFFDENGGQIGATQNLAYGEDPVAPNYTKTETGYTIVTLWKNKADVEGDVANPRTIETVKEAADYIADVTTLRTINRYTVTLRCNLPGACTFTGAGIYDYNTSATIVATPADGYEFVKWQERSGGAELGSLTVTGDITLTAVVKVEDTPLPGNLELGLTGTEESPAASYTDITIMSDGVSQSSQILNAGNITTLYGNADFVLNQSIEAAKWYCVAVPWRVDVNGGILLNGTTPAVLGKNMDICYYDGSVRAAQGKVPACWVYMKNLSTKKVLEPGRAYMIALRNPASSITFRKKVQEPILTTGTSVQEYPSETATDAGWNAIANPSLFHAFVNAGSTDNKAQRYNSADDSYDWFNLNEHELVVGEPIYVQAPAAKSIVVANGASYAPARRTKAQAVPTKYEISVTAAGATKYADHLSIALNEDKEDDQYIIGQDLVKFGVSGKVAQMWIDRYDAKLCVNAVAPEDDATSFPMSLFAPKAGDYTIAIDREVATEDYALYLTYNGQAIWNLSEGAYVANLNKGTDANYGLRISAKAPQVVTGVDEAIVNAQGDTRKVLINNQVFIIRGNNVYSIDGQLIR